MKLEEIATLLEGAGLGLVAGVNLFAEMLPAGSRNVVVLLADPMSMRSDFYIPGRHSGKFQIIVRDSDRARAKTLAYAIHAALTLPSGASMATTRAYWILPTRQPYAYPRPDSDVLEWSVEVAMEYVDKP